MNIPSILTAQRTFFDAGTTKPVSFRRDALKKLCSSIKRHERDLEAAFAADLHKCPFDVFATETGIVLDEISFAIRHLRTWARTERVPTPLVNFPSRSFLRKEPYGVALIIAPWNYPFMLLFGPLVGAIAAGNCVMLKTAPATPHVSAVIRRIIESAFDRTYVAVFEGHRDVNEALLRERYDYIFVTGGTVIGRIAMQAAAKYLTPITLELGGKSPCIVAPDAAVAVSARRIIWGKLLNAGQSCVAPDYCLVHRPLIPPLIEAMKHEILRFYGEHPEASKDLCRIVNDEQYGRLKKYLSQGTIVIGGKCDDSTRYIEPTVLVDVPVDAPVMREEIFGPVLPIIPFDDIQETIDFVRNREKPLALYLFTGSTAMERRVLGSVSFGGGCINDTMVHLANPHLPFGGVGASGMGAYHGKFGFDTFTHVTGILKTTPLIDIPLRYPPYKNTVLRLLRLIMR
ncbi:MAG: aldehyde dehydrogenase [Spirochaetes bacterium]|nr:aldehyde dehydrogenase [Spirochaetota bacterium]